MPILDLPPELLSEILSLTVSNSPSLGRSEYLSKIRILLSFPLVHRQWISVAQEILQREVWISGRRPNQMKRKAERIVESQVKGTRYLTVHGGIEMLLGITGTVRWRGVTYLKNTADLAFGPTKMELFAQHFPNLRTLSLESARFTIESIPSSFSFPHPRRLVLPGSFSDARRPCVDASISLLQLRLSPPSLPNLIHLACDVAFSSHDFILVFSGILPQIESLSIRDVFDLTTVESLRALFERAKKLRHLAVAWVEESNQSLSRFFETNTTVAVHLDTLHLDSELVADDWDFGDQLLEIAGGTSEILKIKEVIIHGPKLSEYFHSKFDYTWGMDMTPFEDFDGSYKRLEKC